MSDASRVLELACGVGHALLVQTGDEARVGDGEAARRRREAHALLMEAATPLAVFDGADHELRFVNHAWSALLGTAPVVRGELDAAFRTNALVQVDRLVFDVAAGREVYCRAALEPVRGPLGTTVGVLVACVDITDEVIAGRLGLGEHDLIWGGPASHGADYYNHAWSTYTGTPPQPWQQIVHPDDLARCVHAFGEAARRRVSTDIEARLRAANGDQRWHRVRFTIIGPTQRWLGSATNIHDTRSAEAERIESLGRERAARADAEQANRLKDQFLAAVSHELRAPLTTMLLWEKVLRDDTADAALHATALEAIRQSAVSQSRLVADLLDVSRGISGKLFIDLRPIAIDTVIREAVGVATAVAALKQITVIEHTAPALGKISGDAHRLRQVLDNLLSNAIKFTEPGGHVTVSTRAEAGAIVIAVVDDGRGIAPEFLSRIFEPFSQTDDALTRAQGGLGLGLSIAHQLVTLHAGTLVATSAGADRGATLTVTLPSVTVPRGTTSPELQVAPAGSVLDRIRVLIVDDDRRVRDGLAILLGRSGAIVETADSAAAARARVAHAPPDALVCDVAMPGEDGYSFVRTIREAGEAIRAIPVIAMTAHATAADADRALASGFDLHVAKPIDLDRLVTSIRELVHARRAPAA